MKIEFQAKGVWKSLTAASKSARKPAQVAVAYFAKGASKLLPLPHGSRLVVDASEDAVRTGKTHPLDLKRLQQRGVVIYSHPFLHAKVYAFDGFAFIGSANVSSRSANLLTEALVRTSDRAVVRSAKTFIRELCRDELTPGRLDQLQKMYRPPPVPIGGTRRPNGAASKTGLPRVFLAQLVFKDPPSGSERASENGMAVAKKRREHARSYVLEDYFRVGKNIIRTGDKVIQVVEQPDGRRLIDAPGDVRNVKPWNGGRWHTNFIYLERPDVRRIGLDRLARRLGYGAKKKLKRDGLVRDRAFADLLLKNWSQF